MNERTSLGEVVQLQVVKRREATNNSYSIQDGPVTLQVVRGGDKNGTQGQSRVDARSSGR